MQKMLRGILFILLIASQTVGAANKWNGSIKKDFDDPPKWVDLSNALKEHHMHYGAVAAARRMLQYFGDIKTKQIAFQALVEATDSGYPFSLADDFISGDIEVVGLDGFSQSYNLYKATVNSRKQMTKWAEGYFSRVDKKNFPKYMLFQALDMAREKKIPEAIELLHQALNAAKGPENYNVSKKAARTLARLYYELNQYGQAFDIYENFLLKLNPVDNNDWIEAAWCLYRLNRNEEAIGYLYNLELKNPDDPIFLEKYTIRSLVYREKCDSISTANLTQSFIKDFGSTLEGIKMGKPLKGFPLLKRIYQGNTDYYRLTKMLQEMRYEKERIGQLPKEAQEMASFLYTSEMANLDKILVATEDDALDGAARSLIILNESLRFLGFDVAREKFDPDKVFIDAAAAPPPTENLITDGIGETFIIHWLQWGDYWRDERSLYRGLLKNRCE